MTSIAASSQSASAIHTHRGLHIALWCVQVLLAALFLMAGVMKVTSPIAELSRSMSFVSVLGAGMTRFIGICEVAGAIGIILPALTRIRPLLTPIAAAGLSLVMVLAAGYHLGHSEFQALPIVAVLGALAGFVAWGRLKKVPIAPRA